MPKNADPRARPDRSILSFLGGAGDVTGSRFLIETPQSTVLVDCGLFQGFKAGRERNWAPFPIDPARIDAVIVTHAHIDHVGYLPRLVRSGFRGDVWCTTRTADLARIVLPDSGHLHEEEAEFANRVGFSKHHPALPLYTEADAIDTLSQLRTVEFGQRVGIGSDIEVVLHPAGHILGSAIVSVDLARSGRRVVFSGDLGRPAHPLLVAPSPPSGADVTVIESTYGGRRHDDVGAVDQLGDLITRTTQTRRHGGDPGVRGRPNRSGPLPFARADGERCCAVAAGVRRQPDGVACTRCVSRSDGRR